MSLKTNTKLLNSYEVETLGRSLNFKIYFRDIKSK